MVEVKKVEVIREDRAGRCPKCGGELEVRKFVDSWNEKGEPVDVNEGLYCPKCGLRWSFEKVDVEDFVENFAERWYCPKCGSHKFKIITKALVEDVYNRSNRKGWNYTDLSIKSDKVLEVQCAKCGAILHRELEAKPISREAWDNFWDEHLTDFIVAFDSYIAHSSEEPEDKFEAYLQGISKGMFALCDMIESEMVAEKKSK